LLLNNVKRLSVNSSEVIHRKDREGYILLKRYPSAAMKNGINIFWKKV
jgi:hypothetical protein